LRAYYNEDFYDFNYNGEKALISTVSLQFDTKNFVVMDVGANRGDWASAVLDCCQDARIFCFEIIPATAKGLKARFSAFPEVKVYEIGLSSRAGYVDVYWNQSADDTSTISPRDTDPIFAHGNIQRIRSKTETGDNVIRQLNLSTIALIKIDVEGHEVEVLEGLKDTLAGSTAKPSVIQFEYGETYIPGRHNLLEIYKLLKPYGYAIGRLYPRGVDFKEYAFADDHFRMGNYVAVQAQSDLERRLRRF
jgi:FkbM family methyltransferase